MRFNFDEQPFIVIWDDHPRVLGGKCGRREFRRICGGSRARAYAMTGSFLGEEPLCSYQPPGTSGRASTRRCGRLSFSN